MPILLRPAALRSEPLSGRHDDVDEAALGEVADRVAHARGAQVGGEGEEDLGGDGGRVRFVVVRVVVVVGVVFLGGRGSCCCCSCCRFSSVWSSFSSSSSSTSSSCSSFFRCRLLEVVAEPPRQHPVELADGLAERRRLEARGRHRPHHSVQGRRVGAARAAEVEAADDGGVEGGGGGGEHGLVGFFGFLCDSEKRRLSFFPFFGG